MGVIESLALGFQVALSAQNLAYCFAGVALGTLIGVLPGIGPLSTIGLLFPITFYLPSIPALIMLAGIYYGAQYGGAITSILLNLPGETSSAVTCLDGYPMARGGRAGAALAISALASFLAGCLGTLLIALAGPPLGEWALAFGSAEYFSLMLMGLVGSAVLTQGDAVKGLAMVVVGLLIGLIGTDVNSGLPRYAFDVPELVDGVGFTVIAVGLFAVAEIATNLERREPQTAYTGALTSIMPNAAELARSFWPAMRGTGVGAFFGLLPGTGPALSSFAAYMLEKKIAREPARFGKGAIEGVAAPEAANNAAAQASFIPTLTLGIPGTAVMTLMLGAMVMQGVTPGPQVVTGNPELFWGIVASMWIGNLMLLVLNLPLVGVWVRLLRIPYRWLFPCVVMFCCIGNYAVNNNPVDVYLCAALGVFGYVLAKLECEPAPLLLGYVLGPLMEEHLRRAMLLSRGDPTVFFTRPISLVFMVATVLVLLFTVKGLDLRVHRRG
ncbi:MAG TPA: tripartite tricarboxylate transporter permease [Burkholderiales bacterium]|jgi:TctA family transporter|nr:tripartite tricarboxylate transporter permease [Burkholderiales bacterium]